MAETRVKPIMLPSVSLSQIQVGKGVLALKKAEEYWAENNDKKNNLFEDDDSKKVFLQISLNKIPKMSRKLVKLSLPHFNLKENIEVCLLTGDKDKRVPQADSDEIVRFYKEKLKEHQVTNIAEVIPLRELKADYSEYEARDKLRGAYDIFLVDKKIYPSVLMATGKSFFTRGKILRQIDLKAKHLKQEITKALAYTICRVHGEGNTYTACIGNITQPKVELVENIMAAVETISNATPGNWENIQALHIKCGKTIAIPIYMSLESPNEIKLPNLSTPDIPIEDELSTLPDCHVKVYTDGRVEVIECKKKKKPSHDPDKRVNATKLKKKRKPSNDLDKRVGVIKLKKKRKQLDNTDERVDVVKLERKEIVQSDESKSFSKLKSKTKRKKGEKVAKKSLKSVENSNDISPKSKETKYKDISLKCEKKKNSLIKKLKVSKIGAKKLQKKK